MYVYVCVFVCIYVYVRMCVYVRLAADDVSMIDAVILRCMSMCVCVCMHV